jgi:type IV fimbrial biogenesis protein FimT
MNFKNRVSGVTLIETVTVMGIVAILAAIAIPSYQYVTQSNRIASEINGLLGDLQLARSEAIKEGWTVNVCVSTDGATCAAGNTAWNNGWVVLSLSPGFTTPLRVQSAFSGTDTLTPNGAISVISFNREGFAVFPGGLPNGALLTLHAATPSNGTTRCLSVTLIGLMAVQPYDGVNCL